MPRAPGSNENTANALGFLLTLVGPAILAGSAILGRATGRQDLFAFLPLIVAFGVVPSLSVCGMNGAEPSPVEPASPATWLFYRLLPVIAVPGQIASLAVAVDYWTDHSLDITGRIGWLLSTGVFSALFAITLAHELIHHLSRVLRALGGILFPRLVSEHSRSCTCAFIIATSNRSRLRFGTPGRFDIRLLVALPSRQSA